LAESGAALSDEAGAASHNPAGLADLRRIAVASRAGRSPLLPELSSSGLSLGLPTRRAGTWGASFERWGGGLYAEREIDLSAAGGSGPASFGASLRRATVSARGYGSTGAWAADAGVLARVRPWWRIGLAARNLSRARFSGRNEGPARDLRFGTAFSFAGRLALAADVVQSAGGPLSFRSGAEVRATGPLLLRFGAQSPSARWAFGLGIAFRRLRIDYAVILQPDLGEQHHADVTLFLGPAVPSS
jgi:hypothetical protein